VFCTDQGCRAASFLHGSGSGIKIHAAHATPAPTRRSLIFEKTILKCFQVEACFKQNFPHVSVSLIHFYSKSKNKFTSCYFFLSVWTEQKDLGTAPPKWCSSLWFRLRIRNTDSNSLMKNGGDLSISRFLGVPIGYADISWVIWRGIGEKMREIFISYTVSKTCWKIICDRSFPLSVSK
jgi:hypothetical protein